MSLPDLYEKVGEREYRRTPVPRNGTTVALRTRDGRDVAGLWVGVAWLVHGLLGGAPTMLAAGDEAFSAWRPLADHERRVLRGRWPERST